MRSAAVIFVFALSACGPKVNVENPSPFEEDDPAAEPTDNPAREPAPESNQTTAIVTTGTVQRSDFETVLSRGPGFYNAELDVEPVMDSRTGVLRGWQIVRWPYTWVDLRVGDVVLSVNDILIVKPDDVAKLWQALEGASVIKFEIERTGETATLEVDIVDSLSGAQGE